MPICPEEPTDDFFDEDEGDLWEAIREDGRLVGRQEWDSGGPGAGAGTVDVYFYRGAFYSDDDAGACGPFETFLEAANPIGLFRVNPATTRIWVDAGFSDRDVAALNEEAAELRRGLNDGRSLYVGATLGGDALRSSSGDDRPQDHLSRLRGRDPRAQ
jgi:hypothetical protein